MGELTARSGRVGAGDFTAYDHGAQLASWRVGGRPVVWVSRRARYRPDTSIRGGVPICWPWFAPGRTGDLSPAHGFARIAPWTLTGRASDEHATRLQWRLTEQDIAGLPGAEHFPHPFEARCELTVAQTVTIAVTVRNTGSRTFDYEVALHAYLHVGDVRQIRLAGLDGATYWDKVTRQEQRQIGDLVLTGETDRIHHSPGPVRVLDPVLGRTITVTKEDSADTVVWNPWADKAAELPDLHPAEWTEMLCVEAGNVGSDAIVLGPDQEHTTGTTIAVS